MPSAITPIINMKIQQNPSKVRVSANGGLPLTGDSSEVYSSNDEVGMGVGVLI